MQHVPRAAGLVAGPHLAMRAQPLAESPEFRYIIGEALDAGWRDRVAWQHRDRDRILVDVEAKIDGSDNR